MDPPAGCPQSLLDRFGKSKKSEPNFWTFMARETLAKFARATGTSEVEIVHLEEEWHQRPLDAGWVGHCHNAAPASVLFEPLKTTTLHGETFTPEELEFLATEFAGNYDDSPMAYQLGHPSTPGEMPVLGMFKPEGSCDDAELKTAADELHPTDADAAKVEYDQWRKKRDDEFGSDPKKSIDAIKTAFGQEAAELFRVLQDEILERHNALTGDLRSINTSGEPNQVWNEAVYCYEASYEEREPAKNDDLRMLVQVTLYANADSVPPGSGGLPANVSDNDVIPDLSGPNTCWVFEYGFVLQFGDDGRVGTYKYATHEWVRCRTRGGGAVYAPRRLIRIVKPRDKPVERHAQTPSAEKVENFVLGNANVTRAFLSTGLGKLRKKFM